MNRLTNIDVSKGLLMLLVVYYHALCIVVAVCPGLCNEEFLFETPYLFRSFFMIAFVVISGITSRFERLLKDQIVHDAKVLLLPAIIISTLVGILCPEAVDKGDVSSLSRIILYGGGAWFITAMFLSRVMYKIALQIRKDQIRYCALIVIWIVGVVFDYYIPNDYEFWYLPKAMIFTPYFEVGRIVNKVELTRMPVAMVCFVAYLLVIPFLWWYGDKTPHFSDSSSVSLRMVPLFGFLSIIGSIAFYEAGKIINQNRFIEFIGRNSLVFYLMHIVFLFMACKLYNAYFIITEHSSWVIYVVLTSLMLGALLWCSMFSILLNTKYLKWILGKF